jgi:DNA (cytosine-5)-methyltransferase 1
MGTKKNGVVVELFAGVGGFRLGLESKNKYWKVEFSNQWEPGKIAQHASDCYIANFGPKNHVCEDIKNYLDWAIDGKDTVPHESKIKLPNKVDLLVGGFPCQDYSVAKSLSRSGGLEGKKGVLWWEINRLIEFKKPKYVLLENVDRLLVSPSSDRGRDFAVMLSCLSNLGYIVSWRVINSAEYGHAQRRKRVFILAELSKRKKIHLEDVFRALHTDSVFANTFPVSKTRENFKEIYIGVNPVEVSNNFCKLYPNFRWENSGIMVQGVAYTAKLTSAYKGDFSNLGSILERGLVPKEFYVDDSAIVRWEYLKGSKKENRVDKKTGFTYSYTEGSMAFPDNIKNPSRTILTGEGGPSPSRFKHIIKTKRGKFRRLTPIELERLQEFPADWTKLDSKGNQFSNNTRAFFMGNALVVGLVRDIGETLHKYSKNNKPIF